MEKRKEKVFAVCVIHIQHIKPAPDGHTEDIYYRPVVNVKSTKESLFYGDFQAVALEDGSLHALKENLEVNPSPDIQVMSLKDKNGEESEFFLGLKQVYSSPWLTPGQPVTLPVGDIIVFEFLPVRENDPPERLKEITANMEKYLGKE